jgi:hypothetical protein
MIIFKQDTKNAPYYIQNAEKTITLAYDIHSPSITQMIDCFRSFLYATGYPEKLINHYLGEEPYLD